MGDDYFKSQVERLQSDGSNWVIYRDRLKMALEAREFHEHLTSNTVTQTYLDAGDINNVAPARRWQIDDRAVKQAISSTIPNSLFTTVKNCTTARDMWEALRTLFEGRTNLILVDLSHRFQSTRCGEEENVREHFDKLSNMREQLAAMGETVTDTKYAQILMGSLPPSYASTLGSIAAAAELSNNPVTPRIVLKLAIDEYERRTLGNTQNEALAADSKTKGKGKKRDVECTNCKKRGHTKAECWAKGGGNEGGGPKRKDRKGDDKDDKGSKKTQAAATEEQQSDIEAWTVSEVPEALLPCLPVMETENFVGYQCELFDSGASRHMSPDRKSFVNYRSIAARPITAANKQTFHAVGMGDLPIDVPNGASSTRVVLRDVLHAPDLGLTVVSIGRIIQAGCSVEFDEGYCHIKKKADGRTIGKIPAANGLFKVDHACVAATSEETVDILTLHRRLGHISTDAIRALIRSNAVAGLHVIDNFPSFTCDSCEHAKMTRKAIRKERVAPLAQAFADEIHTDVWGPSPTLSLGGRKYYVTFTDDYSRYTKLDILRTKDEAFDAYKAYAAWAQTQHSAKIKRLRSDRGGEYTGNDFTAFLRQQGTERRLTTADTPQHNGVAESLNRRLLERVRAMLHQANLPKSLWAEAIQYAVWLKNRTSTKALGNVTPYERLYGEKPNLANVPEWGQNVWVYNPQGSKLDARALQARWVGFDRDSTHAHRVFWPGKNRVSVERNVKFVPSMIVLHSPPPSYTTATTPQPAQQVGAQAPPAPPAPPMPQAQAVPQAPQRPPVFTAPPVRQRRALSAPPDPQQQDDAHPPAPPPTPVDTPEHEVEEEEVEDTITPQRLRRSTRVPKMSDYHRRIAAGEGTAEGDFADLVCYAGLSDIVAEAISDANSDPKSLAEARSRSDWHCWKEAMDREISTLEKAGTWDTVPRPTGKNIVGSKWVFRVKRKADGSVDKYKARLVARGFTQIYGVDYFTTYSPVAKLTSFRTLLAIAARYDWDIESFDFNGAYLNGELEDNEEIYMQSPPGYDSDAHTVKYLRKSLYGLKQAGRRWYDTLARALTDLGFVISSADPGVFYTRVDEHLLVLAVHVDDCILTGSSPDLIAQYKTKLNACYALTDLGPIHWLLGIKITRDRMARTISLSQSSYIDALVSRFSLADAKPQRTPMVPNVVYGKKDSPSSPDEAARMKRTPYREAIGSLMYAAVATRPDIAFAVSHLSQFLDNPGVAHWEAVKRVIRYLATTKSFELTYGGERHDLEGYTDADGATQDHRRAISGYAFLLDGGAISWGSKKQELITLSTAEAEFVAATHAAKEAIWLQRFLHELLPNPLPPTPLFCDNQAALRLATNDNYHARTKHIDVRYHFIRYAAASGSIALYYCPTEDMVADLLTKSLPKWKAATHIASLGMRHA
jgi:hypothetical protein